MPTPSVQSRQAKVKCMNGLGQAFYHRRNALRLTQLEACALARISYDTWNRVETNQRNPTLETLQMMATALGCTIRIALVNEQGEEIE